MLSYFKNQLNHQDVQDDLHTEFIQEIEPEDEDDILDEEQYEIEDVEPDIDLQQEYGDLYGGDSSDENEMI